MCACVLGKKIGVDKRGGEGRSKNNDGGDDDFVVNVTHAGNVGNDVKKKRIQKKENARFPSLRTRSSPRSLWSGLQHLSKKQREAVKERI